MKQSWEKQESEPVMWFDRFARYYLTQGSGRKLIDAYRTFRRERSTSADRASLKVPRAWSSAARKWFWVERAECFDAHERERLLENRFAAMRELTEQHITVYKYIIVKLIRQLPNVAWGSLTDPSRFVSLLNRVVTTQRLLYTQPLGFEEPPKRGECEVPRQEAARTEDLKCYDDPAFYAEVLKVWQQHVEPPDGTTTESEDDSENGTRNRLQGKTR